MMSSNENDYAGDRKKFLSKKFLSEREYRPVTDSENERWRDRQESGMDNQVSDVECKDDIELQENASHLVSEITITMQIKELADRADSGDKNAAIQILNDFCNASESGDGYADTAYSRYLAKCFRQILSGVKPFKALGIPEEITTIETTKERKLVAALAVEKELKHQQEKGKKRNVTKAVWQAVENLFPDLEDAVKKKKFNYVKQAHYDRISGVVAGFLIKLDVND